MPNSFKRKKINWTLWGTLWCGQKYWDAPWATRKKQFFNMVIFVSIWICMFIRRLLRLAYCMSFSVHWLVVTLNCHAVPLHAWKLERRCRAVSHKPRLTLACTLVSLWNGPQLWKKGLLWITLVSVVLQRSLTLCEVTDSCVDNTAHGLWRTVLCYRLPVCLFVNTWAIAKKLNITDLGLWSFDLA